MHNTPQIRLANLNDSAEIARLSGELGYPATSEETRRSLAALLASAQCFVAVACDDSNDLLGWIAVESRVSLESGEKAEITGLVVSASARRAGIGKALVSYAEQWTVQQGLATLRVRSNIARTESHPFYEHLGYLRKKTQHTYEKPLHVREQATTSNLGRRQPMDIQPANLFAHAGTPTAGERFDLLLAHRNLTIERIVSSSSIEPTEYVQPQDEWVAMIQGSATLEVAGTNHEIQSGDYLFLPAGTPHTVKRVTEGSLWLAVHLHQKNSP